VDTFVCNCLDCRKITASMFASNFVVRDEAFKILEGEEKLSKYATNKTIRSGNTMTNHFCSNCGTLMYRVSSGFPGMKIPRIGTIDDYDLQETNFKPRVEIFTESRAKWLLGVQGAKPMKGMGDLAG